VIQRSPSPPGLCSAGKDSKRMLFSMWYIHRARINTSFFHVDDHEDQFKRPTRSFAPPDTLRIAAETRRKGDPDTGLSTAAAGSPLASQFFLPDQ